MSGLVPVNKMDKQHWENFLNYLERAQRGQSIANNATATLAIDLDDDSSDVPSIALTSNTTAAEASDLLKRCSLGEAENVVELSSDSENDDETIWSCYAKCKGYKRLWERARCLVFHRLIPKYYHCTSTTIKPYFIKTAEEQLFPYSKLKELADELRKFQQDFMHNEDELKFLWNNVLQWLLAVNQSLYPIDAKYDEKFNLILIDFMVQYVNYIISISKDYVDEAKINARIQEVVQTLTVILSGNTLHALLVLLRIDLKLEYRAILDPIFRKYLTEPSLSDASTDLVVYLQLIFCFKRWKMITPLKTDRESINELAVGKSLRKLRGKPATEVTDLTTESILPKAVPKVNNNNKFFVSISDLIGFAMERKAFGTRILLVYTSLDLEDAISKYLQLYERYVSSNPGFGIPDITVTSSINVELPTKEPALMTFRYNRDATPHQQQLPPSQQKSKAAAQNLEKQPKNSKSPHETHFDKNCDKNKNSLSYSPSCSVRSSVGRKHTTNTQSDISLSSLSTSLNNNNTEYTHIDLTDSDDDETEQKKSKQNTALLNTSASHNTDMNSKSVSSPQPTEPQNVKLPTSFSRRHREKKQKENLNQTTEIKTNTKNTESTITLTSSASSDDDNSLIKYLKNSDSDTVSRQSSTIPNENALALEQSLPRIAAIPPRCRPLVESVATKPTRKEKHCIPGEVSSTTSPDCGLQTNSSTQSPQAAQERETTTSSFQYNVSNLEVHSAGTLQNAREVGIVKAVQQRVSPCPPVVVSGTCKPGSLLLGIDYSDFSSDNEDFDSECGSNLLAHSSWKVVEEATSSTAEIPKTLPENIVFSTRSDRSRIKSRVNSAEKHSLLRNLPIEEAAPQLSAALNAPEERHESVDRPTCSKYIGKTSTTSKVKQSCPIERISKDKNNLAIEPAVPPLKESSNIENSNRGMSDVAKESEDECISEQNAVENPKNDKENKTDSVATAVADERSDVATGIIVVNTDCQANITKVTPVHCKEKVTNFNPKDVKTIRRKVPTIEKTLSNTDLDKIFIEQNKLPEISFNERVTKQSPIKPNVDALKSTLNLGVEDDKIPSDETEESTEAADIESFLKEIDENLNETVASNNNKDRCMEEQAENIRRHVKHLDGNEKTLPPTVKISADEVMPISQSSDKNSGLSESPLSVDTNTKTTVVLSKENTRFVKCATSENKEPTNDRVTVESLNCDIEKDEQPVVNRITVPSATPIEIKREIHNKEGAHDKLISINIDEKSMAVGLLSEVKKTKKEKNTDYPKKSLNISQPKEDQISVNELPVVLKSGEKKFMKPNKNTTNTCNEVPCLSDKIDKSENSDKKSKSTDVEKSKPFNDKNKVSHNAFEDINEKTNEIGESNKDEELMPANNENKVSDIAFQDTSSTNTDIVNIDRLASSMECGDKITIIENKPLHLVDSDTSSIVKKHVDKVIEPTMIQDDGMVDETINKVDRIELNTKEQEETNSNMEKVAEEKGTKTEINEVQAILKSGDKVAIKGNATLDLVDSEASSVLIKNADEIIEPTMNNNESLVDETNNKVEQIELNTKNQEEISSILKKVTKEKKKVERTELNTKEQEEANSILEKMTEEKETETEMNDVQASLKSGNKVAMICNETLLSADSEASSVLIKEANEIIKSTRNQNDSLEDATNNKIDQIELTCKDQEETRSILKKVTKEKDKVDRIELNSKEKEETNSSLEKVTKEKEAENEINGVQASLECDDKITIIENETLRLVDSEASSVLTKNADAIVEPTIDKNDKIVDEPNNKVDRTEHITKEQEETKSILEDVPKVIESKMNGVEASQNEACLHESPKEQLTVDRTKELRASESEKGEDLSSEIKENNSEIYSNDANANLKELPHTPESVILKKSDINEEKTIQTNGTNKDVKPIEDSKKICNKIHHEEKGTKKHTKKLEVQNVDEDVKSKDEHSSENPPSDEQIVESEINILEDTNLRPAKAKATKSPKDDSKNSVDDLSGISPEIITGLNSQDQEVSENTVKTSEHEASENISESPDEEKSSEEIKIQEVNNTASSLEGSAVLKTTQNDQNTIEVLTSDELERREVPENNEGKTSAVNKTEIISEIVSQIADNLIEEDNDPETLNKIKEIPTCDVIIDHSKEINTKSSNKTSVSVLESPINITDKADPTSEDDGKLSQQDAATLKDQNKNDSEDIITTRSSEDNKISNSHNKWASKNEDEDKINKESATSNHDNQKNNTGNTIKKLRKEEQDSKQITDERLCRQSKLGLDDEKPLAPDEAQNKKDNESKSQSEQICQDSYDSKSETNYNESQEINVEQNLRSESSTTESCEDTSKIFEKSVENEEVEMNNVLEHSQSSKSSNASGRGTPLLDEELNSVHEMEDNASIKNTVSTVFKNLKEHPCTSNEKIGDEYSKARNSDVETKASKESRKLEGKSEAHSKMLPSIEDDVEKRTPWKMRIKRRISQCSDINKEFNLDTEEAEEEEEKHKELSSIHSKESGDNTGIAVTKDADELAINISKLNIKRQKTGSESDQSTAENDLDDLQNSLLSNLGLFKKTKNNLVTETTPPNPEANKDMLDKFEGRRRKQKVVKHVFESDAPTKPLEQMPINYNVEEIVAITALMNMQNKCGKKTDDKIQELNIPDGKANNEVTTETGRRSRLCKAKAPPKTVTSKRAQTTTKTTTAIATKPIKTILKSSSQSTDTSSKSKIKKKVTYDEASILRLEKHSETRKARKAYNNLKTTRSEEGALLKGGNRYIKKRLAEINAHFEQETMSYIKDFNDSSNNSLSDRNNDTSPMALRNKCKTPEVLEKTIPLPRRKTLDNTVTRLAERINCQNVNIEETIVSNTETLESNTKTSCLEHAVETSRTSRSRKKKLTHTTTDDKTNQIMPAILESTSSTKSSTENTKEEVTAETVPTELYPVRLTSRKLAKNSTRNKSTKSKKEVTLPMPPKTVQPETPLDDPKTPACTTETSLEHSTGNQSEIVEHEEQVKNTSDQTESIDTVCDLKTSTKINDADIKVMEKKVQLDREEIMTKPNVERLPIESDDLQSRTNNLKLKKAFIKMKRINIPKHATSSSENASSHLLQENEIKKEPTEESFEPVICSAIDVDIKTEEESFDAIDKFSQIQNDFIFTDPDAEIQNQKSCKEVIVRPCDVILTADIINAQAIRLKEIAREKRKLNITTRRKTAISLNTTVKGVSTNAIAPPVQSMSTKEDNESSKKITATTKVFRKLKPLCKQKLDLVKQKINASVSEKETPQEKENSPSEILKDVSDKITLTNAPKNMSNEIDKETLIEKKTTLLLKLNKKSIIETDEIRSTSTQDLKSISTEEISKKEEDVTTVIKRKSARQARNLAEIESKAITSKKDDVKNTSTETKCGIKQKENTPSQVLSHESIKSDDITSTSKICNQNKRKKTSKVKKTTSSQIPSHPTIQPDVSTAANSTENVCKNKGEETGMEKENKSSQIMLTTIQPDVNTASSSIEFICENKEQETVIEKANKTSQILSHPIIQTDVITASNSTKDICENKEKETGLSHPTIPPEVFITTTHSTDNVCENKDQEKVIEKENTSSQILSQPAIQPDVITASNSTDNTCENKELETVIDKENTTSQILSKPIIEPDVITASSTQIVCKNKEKETLTKEGNATSQILSNENIKSGDVALIKDITTPKICEHEKNKIDIENKPNLEVGNESLGTGEITNGPNIITSKRKKTSKVKKSASSQILSNKKYKPDDNTITTDLKIVSTENVCENSVKETLIEKNKTVIPILRNEGLVLRNISEKDVFENKEKETTANDPKHVSTKEVSENRAEEKENKSSHTLSHKSMESDDITAWHDLETVPSEAVQQEEKIETEKKSSSELSHESIDSPDTSRNELKTKPSEKEENITPSQTLSAEQIISDKKTATHDHEVISPVPQAAPQEKTTEAVTKDVFEPEESADKITECVIAELKLLSPQNMIQEHSQTGFDTDVEIAKKLDQGIEMVLGNKIENKPQKLTRNSIDDKEQKTAALLDSAIEKVLGNSATTSNPTIEMTSAENDKNKQSYQPKTTTEHLDFAIDAILGANNAAKQENTNSVTEEHKKDTSPTKLKLGILTAEKINSSIEKLLENNRKIDLDHKTAETLNQSIEKILGPRIAASQHIDSINIDITTQSLSKKSSPKPEDVTAKKSMNKKYFTDMKIVSANVPEALFADDDSDNSNSGENTGADNLKFFPPILSLDDLLHKKTEQILQIPCCANSDSCNCSSEISNTTEEPTIGGSRQCLGTPNFAIELEVETSTKTNTNEENANDAVCENAIENVSDISDVDAEELPTNLVEANTTNMENFVLSDISTIGIPIDFNMTNESFPDVMDIMLLDQVQQSIDCVISGSNYVQKWSQESYSAQATKKNVGEKGRDKDPVPIPVPSEQHNICISQILESNSSVANSPCANTIGIGQEINYSTINPLDEVEVSTNIGFDLVGNVTVEDLLADDGDDLFAFPELDKTRSRSNSYSNDSENYSNSTNEALENMALTTKIIACDHSYNKEIEEKDSSESCNDQSTVESPKPTISISPSFVSIGKAIRTEVKKSPSHNFTKLKSHPTPYWKTKKVDLKTSTPKRGTSLDEQIEDPTAKNTSDKINSTSTPKTDLSHVQKKLFYNMPELDLAPSKSKYKSVLSKSESLSDKSLSPIEEPKSTYDQKDAQKIVQSIVESSAKVTEIIPKRQSTEITEAIPKRLSIEITEAIPKRLSIEITEMITIPAPSPISQETITTTINESQVNTEVEQEKSSSRSSTPIEISDTTPGPTIITQPIITIQSQTNRLQRMNTTSNQFQGNDYTVIPSSTTTSSVSVHCTPNREPTPTLDEPNKEETSLDDRIEPLSDELIEDTREKKADCISLKRGSTPTMDEPPEKKLCLDQSSKELLSSKEDIFDNLKRESPVNVVVCKPIVEKVVMTADLNEDLQSETLPVQIEEPRKEAKEEGNRIENQAITKETIPTQAKSIREQVKPVEHSKDSIVKKKTCSKEVKKETLSQNVTSTEQSIHKIEYKCSLLDTVVKSSNTESKVENKSNFTKRRNSQATSVKLNVPNSINIGTKPNLNISVNALPKIAKLKDNPTVSCKTSKPDVGKPLPKPMEPEILTKNKPTSTSTLKKSSSYTASSSRNNTSPCGSSSSKTPPTPNNRPHPYHHSPNNGKTNKNKYSYQRAAPATEVKYPTKPNNVPNTAQHIQTAKPIHDKKPHPFILNSGYKPTPTTMPHSYPHKNSTNSGPNTPVNVKLSAADEAELKAKLEAYQKTLPQTKIYKEHREQLRLLKLQEEKLRLEYFEKEKRRQAQKLMSEAQRLKRKSYSETYESHYKKFALSSAPNVSTSNSMPAHHRQAQPHLHNKQPQNRQKYVNKFGEIEKNVASSRHNNKDLVPSKAPLTITTAWEHKSTSVDEIIEHLSKMKKS